ncbi:MAG: hypothetical protein ABSH13_15310 [Candidatus Acidiferrum sp.]|jgi:hypothetical protein
MLLANLALGVVGTVVLAGVYTFHDGILRVDVDQQDERHVHVWAPAAVVPIAMHVVPRRHLERAAEQVRPWLPTLRALTKELEKYPNAEFVDVREGNDEQHVRVRTEGGRLLIDVDEPDEHVHVACPLAMIRDVADELEINTPGV